MDETDEARHDDEEHAGLEPNASRPWLALIEDAEKAFDDWQKKSDNIDKEYANLSQLATTTRDRQFQMFWANIQVLGPSIYSRPPVPVVTPRFKDRKPVPRMASELLERCTIVGFENEDIDGVMRAVRDDLTVLARGCAWVRYETEDKVEKVCIEHADRKDFLHTPSRNWKEVDFVAKRSWLTKKAMRKRFNKTSAGKYKDAAYEIRKDENNDDDGIKKAGVWEIWCKSKKTVVWVTEGVDVVLDEDKPHLKLEGFFPCPKPAYSTVQRRSLVPVPDMLFYKDQLEEINELTARIGALTDAVQVRGFYPAGAGEIGDAIEAAIKNTTGNQVLIPISNWAMVGSGGVKDMIVWLPIDQIATTIVQLIEMRKQLIDDVYQITGLSDIMRGSTVASETLGAQELKSQYGSVRIRDRQNELVRFARDLVRISAEIMAENFSKKSMLDMSQMDIRTDADVAKERKGLEGQINAILQQVEAAKSNPQMMQQAQANPEEAQKMLAQAKQQAEGLKAQIDKLEDVPTIEKIMELLNDQRLRPFVLDIETDSTVAPDENATKQRATEFLTAVGGFLNQAGPMVQAVPQSAKLLSEMLKYTAAQFRAGRQLEGTIEEFADEMAKVAGQPKADPEAMKAQAEAEAAKAKQQQDGMTAQADAAERMANAQKTMAEAQAKGVEAQTKAQEAAAALQFKQQQEADAAQARQIELSLKQAIGDQTLEQSAVKHAQDMDIGVLQLRKLELEIEGVQIKTQAAVATTQANIEATETQTDAVERTTEAKISHANTQTDNSIRSTDASIEAKHEAAEAKSMEPA